MARVMQAVPVVTIRQKSLIKTIATNGKFPLFFERLVHKHKSSFSTVGAVAEPNTNLFGVSLQF